ncbi:SIT4 phosphatase-associated protein-domain-containing protein [Gaertneriomyces semiglobifer]|nr:SIT4 phosphatase-associated protein-domain-containing protein [Gaertneriomyces semiglobifer]
MFWRFGFHSASAIDALLDKEGLTLSELLEEDELLQECKSHNSKLIEYLAKPEILKELLGYITAEDLDENRAFKYPYLACEIFSCEIFSICEVIVANNELLEDFWKVLDRDAPLNPLTASYFSKVNGVLLQKKLPEMLTFIRAKENVVKKLLTHIGSSAIADLLLKLISLEELPEGQGIVEWLSSENLVETLVSRLNPALDGDVHNTAAQTLLDVIAVSYQAMGPQEPVLPGGMGAIMNDQPPSFPQTVGGNALVDELKSGPIMVKLVNYMLDRSAPHSGSTLTNGINIIIELIRRYCSEIEQAEYQQHQYQMNRQGSPLPSDEKLQALATDLNDLLHVIGSKLIEFADLLHHPRNIQHVETTIGKQIPLGPERLKTCELFAEILHLQYLYTSSPLFEKLVDIKKPVSLAAVQVTRADAEETKDEEKKEEKEKKESGNQTARPQETSVADELIAVTDKFIDARILPVCLDLFFEFPWNNFLHSVVYDMIAKVFNTYSYTSSANFSFNPPKSDDEGVSNDGSSKEEGAEKEVAVRSIAEQRMESVKQIVRKLVVSIFVDGELTKRITTAQRQNDHKTEQPRGVRLGYMGHLTYISDEVCKLLDKCATDLGDDIGDTIASETWQEYVNGALRDTKDRDRQPLGGTRPVASNQQVHLPHVTGVGGGFSLDDADTGGSFKPVESTKRESDDDDDELDNLAASEVFRGEVEQSDQVRYPSHDSRFGGSGDDGWSEEGGYD